MLQKVCAQLLAVYIFCLTSVKQLIYNIVLICAVQQSDSVIHIYVFLFTVFSIMIYQRNYQNLAPCAIQ